MEGNTALKLSGGLSATVRTVQGARARISILALLDWAYRKEMVWELAGAFGDGGAPGLGRGSAAACLESSFTSGADQLTVGKAKPDTNPARQHALAIPLFRSETSG